MEPLRKSEHQLDLSTQAVAYLHDANRLRLVEELRINLFRRYSHRQISNRAYELWEQAGHPRGAISIFGLRRSERSRQARTQICDFLIVGSVDRDLVTADPIAYRCSIAIAHLPQSRRWDQKPIACCGSSGSFAPSEIDENLIRRDLTPAQRARLIAKRKAAYEAVHPGTNNGGNRRSSVRQLDELIKDRFTADTATKTGKPERTIQHDASRAKALGLDLDRVAGTSLEKGAELDALSCCRRS